MKEKEIDPSKENKIENKITPSTQIPYMKAKEINQELNHPIIMTLLKYMPSLSKNFTNKKFYLLMLR